MKTFKKSLSVVLSFIMVFSVIATSFTNTTITAQASETTSSVSGAENPYGLPDKMSEGAILHAWCWSFNTIKANLPVIAEAGYKSVQTSPINKCLVGDNGGMQLMGNGKWYYHYQPTLYTIGNYQLGTLEEFKSLCTEADKYGINLETERDEYYAPADSDSPAYKYTFDCLAKVFPRFPAAPYILPAGTDAWRLTPVCNCVMRFAPTRMSKQQLGSIHASDENLDISAVAEAAAFYKYFVVNYR